MLRLLVLGFLLGLAFRLCGWSRRLSVRRGNAISFAELEWMGGWAWIGHVIGFLWFVVSVKQSFFSGFLFLLDLGRLAVNVHLHDAEAVNAANV